MPDDFYARVADLAKSLGKRLVLDTSGAALKQAGRGIYLLKPSLRELQDLTGREIRTEREQERAARADHRQGRSDIVVLSLGEEGALLATAEGSERFAAIPVQARSTVGAGDSMLAGIVLGLSRGLALREAVRFGMAAGAAALLGSGTALCRSPMSSGFTRRCRRPDSVRFFWVGPSETAPLGVVMETALSLAGEGPFVDPHL